MEWEAKVDVLSTKLSRANAAASAAEADRDADAAEARARADAAAQAEDSATARTDGILAAAIAEAQGKSAADAAALESAKEKIKAQATLGLVLAPPKKKGFVNPGASAGIEQWSVAVDGGAGGGDDDSTLPECTLKKVLKGKRGLFNDGDCYLVLNAVATDRRGEFEFTIYLWVGPESEIAERKHAAAMAFDLEQALTGVAKYVRVVGGRESKAWKALWRPGQYKIMAGGSDTAFDPDDPLDWDPVS